jgi:hypothetical protein
MTEPVEGRVVEIGPRFRLRAFDQITVGSERVYASRGSSREWAWS